MPTRGIYSDVTLPYTVPNFNQTYIAPAYPLMASMTRKDHGTSQGRKEPSVSIAVNLGCMICKELSSKNVSQVLHLEQKPTKDYHITVPAS